MRKKNNRSRKNLNIEASFLESKDDFPLLILPMQVLFPKNLIPIASLRDFSSKDYSKIKAGQMTFGVLTELEASGEQEKNIAGFGTEATVTALIKLPNGELGAMIRGGRRFVVGSLSQGKRGLKGQVSFLDDVQSGQSSEDEVAAKAQNKALEQAFRDLMMKFVKAQSSLSQENAAQLFTTDHISNLTFLVAPYLSISLNKKMKLLACFDRDKRVRRLVRYLGRELELLTMSNRIQDRVKEGVHDNMRRGYLREQMHLIKKELGDLGGAESDDAASLKEKLDLLDLPKMVQTQAFQELDRLAMMQAGSPEYLISWTFLNWVKDLPWDAQISTGRVEPKVDLKRSAEILDQHHSGLEKIKGRILEFLAVVQHRGQVAGQILLFVGPPGVGKTSLGKAIATTLDRPFVRVSLGGVKDEAEIRGHRRTYIGAMPGKLIQGIKDAGSQRAVVLLDEIDKVGRDGIRDLSAALLEVLDPEQNKSFTDHYLNFPYDLSNVLFIATANSLQDLSAPLLDRMELIELSGYTETEKINIAKQHLIPRIRKDFSLTGESWKLDEAALPLIIRHYTREAGVRQLNRSLTTIARKVIRRLVEKKQPEQVPETKVDTLVKDLGAPRYLDEGRVESLPPGIAIGMAYTSVGGDILYIESRKSPAEAPGGKLVLTGSLGKIMQESAQTVFSFLASHSEMIGLESKEILSQQIHIHLPDGATPKDGPSAGVALLCALTSLFNGVPLRSSFAMTGEITLRGKVLPVGGIKEKIIAAHRYQKTEIILPAANWLDLEEIPDDVLGELKLYPVNHMIDVLYIAGLVVPTSDRVIPQPRTFDRSLLNGDVPFQTWSENSNWICQ